MSANRVKPFPFIVGSGRCGTTLLRVILIAGGEIAIPPESHFIVSGYDRRSLFERPDTSVDLDRFVAFLPDSLFGRWGIDRATLCDGVRRLDGATYPEIVRGLFRWYAEARGRTRYGDKTPNYVLRIGPIAATLSEARFIHLIRDGRDVSLSFLEVGFGTDRMYDGILRWKQRVEAGRRAGAALGDRYIELRYEDLVASPEEATRRVCRLADLDFSHEMLRYHEQENRWDHAGLPWLGNLSRPPTPGIRDWRSQLGAKQAAVCSILAGSLLEDLGYEVPKFRRTARLQAEAASAVASFQARRSIHAARKRLPRAVSATRA